MDFPFYMLHYWGAIKVSNPCTDLTMATGCMSMVKSEIYNAEVGLEMHHVSYTVPIMPPETIRVTTFCPRSLNCELLERKEKDLTMVSSRSCGTYRVRGAHLIC